MPSAEVRPDADPVRFPVHCVTLREELRFATRAAHAVLDQSMAGLRLADPTDLVRFLKIHFAARVGIEDWLGRNVPSNWALPVQTGLIAQDLIALGNASADYPTLRFNPGPAAGWLGPAYVVAGSHLGNRLLLAQAGAAVPNDARRFLASKAMQDYWVRLQTLLAGMPGSDGGAGAITAARATFGHFSRSVALSDLPESAAA